MVWNAFQLHQILQGMFQMKKIQNAKSVFASPLLSSIIVIITIVKTIIIIVNNNKMIALFNIISLD